jgi:hypothetical protein
MWQWLRSRRLGAGTEARSEPLPGPPTRGAQVRPSPAPRLRPQPRVRTRPAPRSGYVGRGDGRNVSPPAGTAVGPVPPRRGDREVQRLRAEVEGLRAEVFAAIAARSDATDGQERLW